MNPAVEFLKIIGNGPRSARDFTRDEAANLIRALFADAFTEAQLGALFLVMRRKSETRDEMTGFVEAWEALFPSAEPNPSALMIGAPFDGKKRTLLLTPMAMLVLAQQGQTIHAGHTQGLGPKRGTTLLDAIKAITAESRFAALTLPRLWDPSQTFPIYERWKKIRNEIGLRGFLHTVEKYLNPYRCGHCLVSIHHEPYMDLFLNSAEGRSRQLMIMKGDEGSPDIHTKHNTVYTILKGGQETDGTLMMDEFGLTPVDYVRDVSPAALLRFWTTAMDQPHSMEARWLVAQTALFLLAAGHGNTALENRDAAITALDTVRQKCR